MGQVTHFSNPYSEPGASRTPRRCNATRTADQASVAPCASRTAPVNTAGIPWTNVQALRGRGDRRAARRLQPLRAAPGGRRRSRAPGGLVRQQATQWRAFARLAPKTDIFHFYFGLTLLPKSVQFPLAARARQALGHALPRLRHPRQDAGAARVGAARGRTRRRLVRRDPLGAGRARDPAGDRRARDRARAAVGPRAAGRAARAVVPRRARARSMCRGVQGARRRARDRRGTRPSRGVRALSARRRDRRPAATQAGTASSRSRRWRSASRSSRSSTTRPCGGRRRHSGCEVPIVSATKETLASALRPLVESVDERRRVGAREPRVRGRGARPRAHDRPPARALRWASMSLGARS